MDTFERAMKALNITVVQINVLSSENGGSATLGHVRTSTRRGHHLVPGQSRHVPPLLRPSPSTPRFLRRTPCTSTSSR